MGIQTELIQRRCGDQHRSDMRPTHLVRSTDISDNRRRPEPRRGQDETKLHGFRHHRDGPARTPVYCRLAAKTTIQVRRPY